MTSLLGSAGAAGPSDVAAAILQGRLEMLTPDGQVRPHWRAVHEAITGMGPADVRRLRRQTSQMLRDDGVTYHAPRTGERRAWQLDPLPLVIGADEWAEIDAAVTQRAELLNLILQDLYGKRTLLAEGLLPPEIIYGHPAFLREADGVMLPGSQQLFTYAVDLARQADGSLIVLGDRTQAPSGAAYALQNRIVTSRVLGKLHRTSGVQRIEPYFRALRKGLQQVAPTTSGMPRTVLLTPGSRNETAFEHALLAARLGLSLVEGSDLRVRDGRVHLRTLGHPEPVDVIVRRLDETWSDPLELRPESLIGVPGLLEAVRTGAVSVVNSLGSGVLENPALGAFLPALATRMLGHSLRLPMAETVWLGVEDIRSSVMEDMRRWVFKPLAREGGQDNTFVASELDDPALQRLRARILSAPRSWTAQEPVQPALAPTLDGDGITHRPTILRVFAVADGSSYTVMPGGLTRVGHDAHSSVIANHAGAWAKDTWVLGAADVAPAGFWSDSQALMVPPADAAMSSRAAQHLYWLGRYAERAEGVARLLREIEARRTEFNDEATPAASACIRALLQALTHITTTYPGFVGAGSTERLRHPDPELSRVAGDAGTPGSLAHAIANLLDAVDAVRDQLSGDTWLVVVDLRRRVDMDLADAGSLDAADVGRILHGLLAIQGLAAENMIRDAGWRFMDAGRRIERSLQILALLRATTTHVRDGREEGLIAESVLRVAESIITYRRRYRSTARTSTLLDLLMLDPDNPRSLTYQFDRLSEDLRLLPGHPGTGRITPHERPVLEASTALRVADTARMAQQHDGAVRGELDQFLDHLYGMILAAAEELRDASFDHAVPQRTLRGDMRGRDTRGDRL